LNYLVKEIYLYKRKCCWKTTTSRTRKTIYARVLLICDE